MPKNLAIACQLFKQAAMGGQLDAMFNLASMLIKGKGGDKDLGMAYVWFSLAKASGFERAGAALAQIVPKLSPDERTKGGCDPETTYSYQ